MLRWLRRHYHLWKAERCRQKPETYQGYYYHIDKANQ
ncbi:hypothetical protein COHCIP112018_02379 [Cohnella sp. JJ-181]|nr:hypothetical protein COHCIP112018_02379 [Cohnella sp. JJ-181]